MSRKKHTEEQKNNDLFSDKQWEYIAKAHARWNIKVGAVRSGKSYVDIAYMIVKRLNEVKGKDGLNVILGVSNGTIERNVLQPMRSLYGRNTIGNINSSSGIVKIFGQDVYCIGAEKVNAVGKIQGMSIKYAYGDEIAKWNKDVFMMLESRLDKSYSCFDGTCNPEGPNHWFKKWLDNKKINKYEQDYILVDNIFLPQEFIQSLQNEYEGTVYYDRYILGKWALAEGLIYPMYQQAIAEPPKTAIFDDYCISIDYGTENAFAALKWAHNVVDGVWYCLDEYYYSGRNKGIQKTDEEYGNDLDRFTADITTKREQRLKDQLRQGMTDPDFNKLEVIIDPSAASFIALLKKKKWYRVRKANNDVLDGIRDTASAMKTGRIKISPKCANGINELGGYVWNTKAVDAGIDKPLKVDDHFCDAARYFVYTKHIMRREKEHVDLSGLITGTGF